MGFSLSRRFSEGQPELRPVDWEPLVRSNDLKRHSEPSNLKGVYTPYWTFDSQTDSPYTGERGDDYWTTGRSRLVGTTVNA